MHHVIGSTAFDPSSVGAGHHEASQRLLPTPEADQIQPRRIWVCDSIAVMAEGLRSLVSTTDDLRVETHFSSLVDVSAMLRMAPAPDVLMLDRGVGMRPLLDWLDGWKSSSNYDLRVGIVIWGVGIDAEEALRFFRSGARGILLKTADAGSVITCLRTVAEGQAWVEVGGVREPVVRRRSDLTSREFQVLQLVERGYRNQEIADELGIQVGTVKLHVMRIFDKTGIRQRSRLVLERMTRDVTG